MSYIYGTDDNKNLVEAYEQNTINKVGTRLADGSVIFYDRGANYGEYNFNDDCTNLVKVTGNTSINNWRYLIAEEYDLDHYDPRVGTTDSNGYYEGKIWGSNTDNIITSDEIGYGYDNTRALRSRYGFDSSTIWYYIRIHNLSHIVDWYVPSKGEMEILVEQAYKIIPNCPWRDTDLYWSSSVKSGTNDDIWCANIIYRDAGKTTSPTFDAIRVRLIRRV